MPCAPPGGIVVRAATSDDLQRICAYDRPRSGFARSPIVTHLLTRAPALARVAERADGTLAGYALGRDGYRALHVGPVVAEDEAIGLALLSSALAGSRPTGSSPMSRTAMAPFAAGSRSRALPRRAASCACCAAATPRIDEGTHVFALAGPELA